MIYFFFSYLFRFLGSKFASFFVSNRFENVKEIKNVSCPTLIIHGKFSTCTISLVRMFSFHLLYCFESKSCSTSARCEYYVYRNIPSPIPCNCLQKEKTIRWCLPAMAKQYLVTAAPKRRNCTYIAFIYSIEILFQNFKISGSSVMVCNIATLRFASSKDEFSKLKSARLIDICENFLCSI